MPIATQSDSLVLCEARPDAFEFAAEVRDYECDMHGVVNNAVYLNYLEHARRSFLKSKGLSFAKLSAQGVKLLMVEVSVKYQRSLVSGDGYLVRLGVKHANGLLVFTGDIFRAPDGLLCTRSLTKIAVLDRGALADAAFIGNLISKAA